LADNDWDDGYEHRPRPRPKYKSVEVVDVDYVKVEGSKHYDDKSHYTHYDWKHKFKGIYLKGQFGLGEYSSADNASGTSSWGLSVGKRVNPRLSYEFGFVRTSYEVNDPRGNVEFDYYGNASVLGNNLRDLDQYNFNSLVDYKLFYTRDVSVAFRTGISYVTRESSASTQSGFAKVKSDAFDAIFGVSSDIRLGEGFFATGSFDYFTNIFSDVTDTGYNFVTRVEESDYYVFGVGLKYEF